MPGRAASVSLLQNEEPSPVHDTYSMGAIFFLFLLNSGFANQGSRMHIYGNVSNVRRDWNTALHIWSWISDGVVRYFPDRKGSGGRIEKTNTPSGLRAQPPVTPSQPPQEIIPFQHRQSQGHQDGGPCFRRGRENRSYLDVCLPGSCSSQSLPPDGGHTEPLGRDSGHYRFVPHQ